MIYRSYSGFIGLVAIFGLSIVAGLNSEINQWNIVAFAFIFMAIYELLSKRSFDKKYNITYYNFSKDLIKSSIYRFLTYLIVFSIIVLFIYFYPYFQKQLFNPAKDVFIFLYFIFVFFGFFYIYQTLKNRNNLYFQFSDYSTLIMIFVKNLLYKKRFYTHKRIKKVFLSYLVSIFFLTLMCGFFYSEIDLFKRSFRSILSDELYSKEFFVIYKSYFYTLYHFIFTADTALGIIGYATSSRWLNNRVKSVDVSLFAWVVALICYPPFNNLVGNEFLNYSNYSQVFIENEIFTIFSMSFVLFLYTIYLLSTATLGFKFSNLSNKGIVDFALYKYIKHPAYISKNIAWWFENIYVLSNFWAFFAMIGWNIIYYLRAKTEEKHLLKDKDYSFYIQHNIIIK